MDPSQCVETLRQACEDNVKQLFEIWEAIGYAPNKIADNVLIVQRSVTELLMEMVTEEKENKAKLLSDIEKMLAEANALSKELSVDYQSLIAGLEDNSVPLIQVNGILKERVEELRKKKEKLLAEYSDLLKTEERLCNSMGLHKQPKIPGVPNEDDLDRFSKYLQEKQEEENELSQQFLKLKEKIEAIRSELDMEPDTSFHRQLVSGHVSLHAEHMMLAQSLYETMVKRLEAAKERASELREKLASLWDRLQVPPEDRNRFLDQYPGYSMKVIDALKREIKVCEDKKRQNIRVFVDTLRKEIEDWWDKCCFGEPQRRNFRAFYTDCYTEDLLDLHELEAERLRNYFEKYRGILDLTQKWNELWSRSIELDVKARDPKRLFGNRGGQLLREEKERKTLQRQLPQIEEELTKCIDEYEKENNSTFLYNGKNLKDLMNERWDNWHKRKETERETRKRERDVSSERDSKRKVARCNTPVASSSKKTPVVASGSGRHRNVTRRIYPKAVGNTPVTPAQKNSKEQPGAETDSQDPSYADFQRGMEKKTAVEQMARSTGIPVLRERNNVDGPQLD